MKRTLVFTLLAVLCSLGLAQDLAAQDLTITNARVIVGNGTVIERGAVVVRGGRIASVGQGAPASTAGLVIDAKGMTVVPGYIDGHRHINTGPQEAARMQEFLEAGYTTLMSGGGPAEGNLLLKEHVEKGVIKGPRIITSGRVDPSNFKTPEAARAEVQRLGKLGIEIVKARIDNKPSPESLQVLAATVEEAKKFNLHVMVHAVSPEAMLAAVKAGSKKLVHTPHFGWLSDADAKVVKDAGVDVLSCAGFGVPVFGVFNQNNVPTFRDGGAWPTAVQDGEGRGREAGYKTVNARTLWDNGVVYGYGTDTGYLPKHGLAHELRTLSLMFSPQDLIKIMGPNSAAFIDKGRELGTVETGKLADLVMLPGNPLEGHWHLLNPTVVIKGGQIMVDKR